MLKSLTQTASDLLHSDFVVTPDHGFVKWKKPSKDLVLSSLIKLKSKRVPHNTVQSFEFNLWKPLASRQLSSRIPSIGYRADLAVNTDELLLVRRHYCSLSCVKNVTSLALWQGPSLSPVTLLLGCKSADLNFILFVTHYEFVYFWCIFGVGCFLTKALAGPPHPVIQQTGIWTQFYTNYPPNQMLP